MRIGKNVPVRAEWKPSGKYMMSELISIGGIVPLMKTLLEEGLLHGDVITVRGRTLAENLKDQKKYSSNQEIVRPMSNPIKKDSHLRILYGNLAPEGSVAKLSGKEVKFRGVAKPFNSEEDAMEAIMNGKIKEGDVITIESKPLFGAGEIGLTYLGNNEQLIWIGDALGIAGSNNQLDSTITSEFADIPLWLTINNQHHWNFLN